jgi:hypothetical protein
LCKRCYKLAKKGIRAQQLPLEGKRGNNGRS